jgi:DNA-binding transcriptional LysR family regulator
VRVQLLDNSPGEQIAALRDGRIDLGLVGESGRLVDREFYVRKLATVPAVVLMPDNHPLAVNARISLRELKNETFIPLPDHDAPAYLPWLKTLCRKAGFRPKLTEPAESMSHLGAMVTADLCVAGALILIHGRGASAGGNQPQTNRTHRFFARRMPGDLVRLRILSRPRDQSIGGKPGFLASCWTTGHKALDQRIRPVQRQPSELRGPLSVRNG